MAAKRSDEFRREAVRIALTSGLTRKQVASDLGIGFSTLSKWIRQSLPDTLPPAADLDLAKENERLRKENRLLKEERDLLKPARWREAKYRQRCSSRSKANEICLSSRTQ